MKQTAVEWLDNQIKKSKYFYKVIKDMNSSTVVQPNVFEQAKEMEKQQLRECWRQAQAEQRKEFSSSYVSKKFETWYEEFKSKDYDNRIV
jgi:hypothetical protein